MLVIIGGMILLLVLGGGGIVIVDETVVVFAGVVVETTDTGVAGIAADELSSGPRDFTASTALVAAGDDDD